MSESINKLKVDVSSFDGFYFHPVSEEDVGFDFFQFNTHEDRGEKVVENDMGDMYHIVLWSNNEDGIPEINDQYEAILIDPVFYASRLVESHKPSYGVIVKKTTKSFKFIDTYMIRFEESVKKAIETIMNSEKPKKRWFK